MIDLPDAWRILIGIVGYVVLPVLAVYWPYIARPRSRRPVRPRVIRPSQLPPVRPAKTTVGAGVSPAPAPAVPEPETSR